MECGVIYIKVVPPKDHNMRWLKHSFISMPKSVQPKIKELADRINSRPGIVIPMDVKLHPGCATTPEIIEEVAKEMYEGFSNIFEGFVRCVYSVGELSDKQILLGGNDEEDVKMGLLSDVDSVHHLLGHKRYDEVIIRVGEFLDSSDEVGIFKV